MTATMTSVRICSHPYQSHTHHFGGELEELGLGSGGVAQQEHVDVTAAVSAVGHGLFGDVKSWGGAQSGASKQPVAQALADVGGRQDWPTGQLDVISIC